VFHQLYYSDDQVEEDEMGRECSSRNERKRKASTKVVMAGTYISWSGSTMGYT
jgi:hypothetical protein